MTLSADDRSGFERRNETPPARNVIQLLNETFAVYGGELWSLMRLVAVVQVPIALLTVLVFELISGGNLVFVATFLLGVLGTILTYAAAVIAIGQHYVTGSIRVVACYTRVWWRIQSLTLLTGFLAAILYVIVFAPTDVTQLGLAGVVLLMAIVGLSLLIYWSMSVPATMVEGRQGLAALRRSYMLVRGTWWRVLGISVVTLLVALGLGLLVNLPFALVSAIAGLEHASQVSAALRAVGGILVQVVVAPVVFTSRHASLLRYSNPERGVQLRVAFPRDGTCLTRLWIHRHTDWRSRGQRMARYTDPVCRQCRRIGEKLFLKGERCYTPRCAVDRRKRPPGDHIPRRRRSSEWALQLREKQKARFTYGVLERQFRKYYEMAQEQKGVTGDLLLQLLERRLDNVIYRLSMADSRRQGRQLVTHGHFTVNGRRMDIPSHLVKQGDVVAWKKANGSLPQFVEELTEGLPKRPVPQWLRLDQENLTGEVVAVPDASEVDTGIDSRLIVEFYSK